MPKKKLPEKRQRMIHIRLTDDLHKKLKIKVAEDAQTIQDWVAELIQRQLAGLQKSRK